MKLNTKVKIGKITMKTPVATASGTFGYGVEFDEFVDLNRLGAIVVKGISVKPVKGNRPQRIVETPAGMINAIGLQNVGVDKFISEKLPSLREFETPVIANIYGTDVKEYIAVSERLNDTEVKGIEVNISCPNVKKGGLQFAGDVKAITAMLKGIKKVYDKTIIVKLSPNTGNIEDIAAACEDNGADSVSLINTLVGLSIDLENRRPHIANVFGGLSGPAIKPVALAMVHKVSRCVKVPVMGIGGIMNEKDALEFLVAGATAVQIGTANFVDPSVSEKIVNGIERYMVSRKIHNIKTIIGSLKY